MANRLEKTIRVSYIPGSPGTPAYPGQQYQPPRTVTHVVNSCGGVSGSPDPEMPQIPPGRVVTDPATGRQYWVPTNPRGSGATGWVVSPGTTGGTSGFGGARTGGCRDITVSETIPAVPYIPPSPAIPAAPDQIIQDLNLGWNSGARSARSETGNISFTFRVRPNATGVAIGFNGEDNNYGYVEIDHAWYFAGGNAKIYERGTLVHTAGAYTGDETFELVRRDNVVEYYIDSVLEYTSALPSYGLIFVDVSLYSGSDYVYDPVFSELGGSGALSFEELSCFGGEGSGAQGLVSFLEMTCEGSVASRGAVSFRPLECLGIRAGRGQGVVSFEALTADGDGYGLELLDYSIAYPHFEPMQLSAYGHTAVGADLEFEPLEVMGTDIDNYGQGEVSFEPLFGGGSAYEGPFNASMFEYLLVLSDPEATYTLFVVMDTNITVASTIAVVLLENVDMTSEVEVTAGMTTSEILTALMNTMVQIGFSVPIGDAASEVWVVNADRGGSTMYEGFDYNSFGIIGGQYYGMRSDGLYLLEGDDDEGGPIRASVSFGKRDFHTPKKKRLANAYFGISSTGRMFVRVTADGESYVYATRTSSEELKVQRADLGKGLRANYFELELYNENGADFELDTVEFVPAVIERRI